MSKHQSNSQSDRNKPATLEMDGVSLDRQKRLDSTFYEQKYPDMKFMWILDINGEVDKWRRVGATIQKVENDLFEDDDSGYQSRNNGGYVSVIGGTDHGVPVEQILLKMPKDRYQKLVIDPKQNRNQSIREAMGYGRASASDRDGSDLDTYAPNLPTGGQGFEKIGGKAGFNQLTNKG